VGRACIGFADGGLSADGRQRCQEAIMRAGIIVLCIVAALAAGCVPVGIQGKTNRLAAEPAVVVHA
jgi:hypothetical protein